jgi:hypothetical protein
VPTCIIWTVKGGSGASVVAAGAALAAARRGPTLLVDLCGDQPALLGVDDHESAGVAEWQRAVDPREDSLRRLGRTVAPSLDLLTSGADALPAGDSWPAVAPALAGDSRSVVVDAGHLPEGADPRPEGGSVLVVRACYLALRRLGALRHRPDRVVLIVEPGRALDRRDVERVVGAPVVATLDVDAAVARRVDAGLLLRRPPSNLLAVGRRVG